MNSFEQYQFLRAQQLHYDRLQKQSSSVPTHLAYSSSMPNLQSLQKAKDYHQKRQSHAIDVENQKILQKLVKINQRGVKNDSNGNNSNRNKLPIISQRQFKIPQYENQNNIIAKKINSSRSHIKTQQNLQRYRTLEQRKRRISKFQIAGSEYVNKSKYIAQVLLLRKMKNSRLNPE